MRTASIAALASCALAALGPITRADDKSSTRPNVISVPSGPGSMAGLGESFEANLNSGSARETVKLEVPPGTAGLAPSLALTYDSGFGNGALGIGWSLGLSTIQVQTEKGLPRYEGTDRYLLDGSELVPLGGGVYRLKIEGRFARVRRSSDHWEVDLPDGRTLRYGVSAGARVASADGTTVFSWALEDVIDRWGNRIGYFYTSDQGQLYLSQIQYNRRAGAAENLVTFDYEPRPDVATDCRARFCVATAQRVRLVSMYARGRLVRRYRLGYDEENGVSLLHAVTQIGSDDQGTLPPVKLWYSPFAAVGQAVAMQSAPGFLPGPGAGNDELVDIDGDGFPDLLHAETGAHWYYLNQGGLRFGPRVDMPWSPSFALATSGVEVADLNGDGIPDLVAKTGTNGSDFRYFPNLGKGEWESSVLFTNSPPFGFEDPNVRMLDFDGDKLIDVIQSTSSGFNLWRNRGDGSWDGPFQAPLPPGATNISFTDSHVKLADMNGDRLLDLVYVRTGSVVYWPSLGWGQFGAPVEVANAPDPGLQAEASLMLADMNGDGLADLVWVDADHVDIWPLLPSGACGAKITIENTPHYDPSVTTVRLADMNGNGSTDIVWSTPTADADHRLRYLDVVGDLRPNLLVAVENGLGKTLLLKYSSSGSEYQDARDAGQPWATRVPFPVQVVAESTLQDGLGHQYVTGYRYRDGWYAPDTREFRGFAQVVKTEVGDAFEATLVEAHEFDLGQANEALKAVPLSVEVRTDVGALMQRETFAYQVHRYATGTDGTPVAGPDRTKHEVEHWEGTSSPVTTREEWTYDGYGNVLVHSEWGIVDGTNVLVGNDERITTTEYANDTSSWLLGRATRVTVTDANVTVVSDTKTYYDGDPFVGLPYGQLGTAGAASRTESWVSGTRWAQTQRVQRDAFGLTTATLDPLGARREVDYDPETHTFPVTERAYYGNGQVLTFSASYDLSQGFMTSYTDPAGRQTVFEWDALHRLTGIVKPGDSAGSLTLTFEYAYGNPLSSVRSLSRVTVGQPDVIEKWSWYDGLGRQLAVVAQAEGGQTVTTGLKEFGARGHVAREYEPQWTQGYTLPSPATKCTEHHYDALGRRVRSILPDGSAAEERFSPLAIEHWDAEDLDPASPHHGTPKTERFTALGLVEVDERLGAEALTTKIGRDPLGRIASVTDALGNVATWVRDGLGRVVEVNDPDAGVTTFDFDDAGNLRHRTDARGAYAATDYDELGRPIAERLVDAAGNDEEKVAYHYDNPSPIFPGDVATGELAWVEDGAGEVHYRRDERGRIVELVRKVDGKSYHSQNAYDDLDRVTNRSFPDDRSLDYHYNPRGLLESVPGVISSIAYDPRGLFTRREHSNGAVTTASYDDVRRLSSLGTESRGKALQSLGYRYDQVGNLTAIDDALRSSGPLSASRTLGYDDLYRLVSAVGGDHSWTYAFNAVGDFTTKSDVGDYSYGKAHQLSSAGGKSYRYDEAGNVIERPGSKQAFDAKGRLKAVTLDDGTAVAYRYDYTGRRVVKESHGPRGDHKTVYVDAAFEERDGQAIDYVMAGNTRLARLGGKEPVQAAAGALARVPPALSALAAILFILALLFALGRSQAPARSAVAIGSACSLLALTTSSCSCGHSSGAVDPIPATHYYGDHLGGTTLLTAPDGSVAAEIAYDPWGAEIVGATEPYAFTGKEYEPDTGLYDFAARVYDPVLGRFLSPDPLAVFEPGKALGDHDDSARMYRPEIGRFISPDTAKPDLGNPATFNRYAYVLNNPYRYVDPTGHFAAPANVQQAIRADQATLAQTRSILNDPNASFLEKTAAVLKAIPATLDLATGGGVLPMPAVVSAPGAVAEAAGVAVGEGLPDATLVCRGGTCTAERFAQGTGVTIEADGTMSGVSVNSAPGRTVGELTKGIPNKQVGVSTVGEVRAAGGDVVSSPTRGNPAHATMSGVTPQQAEKIFTPTIPNPNVQ